MRLALGTPAPARFMTCFITAPFRPVTPLLPGPLVSATSTSPLGSTYSQRGSSRPPAHRVTVNPGSGVGLAPLGKPSAGAMSTDGIRVRFGHGQIGRSPGRGGVVVDGVEP